MNRNVSAFRKIEYPERNILINSGFDHWQRGTTFTGTNIFTADRWKSVYSHTATHSIDRDTDVPSDLKDHVSYSLKYTVTSGASTGAAEFSLMGYPIEGFDFTPLMGKYVTISFYAKTNLPGTYTALLKSGIGNYRYTFEFEVSQANTWQRIEKTVYIIDTAPTGTFGDRANLGCWLYINLGVGSSFHTTPDTWVNGSFFGTSIAVDLLATTSNYFSITGMMLTEGDKVYPFSKRGSMQNDYDLCKRYYRTGNDSSHLGVYLNASTVHADVCFDVEMRAIPTVVPYYGGTTGVIRSLNNGALPATTITVLVGTKGFGRCESAGLYVAGNNYHFAYRADAEF